ncbi:MAG: DEAD/DEAH box helicase [Acidobacteriota bacterium]|nr:DEAD/DEAH box helicase [Acidobacteriota bacterium]
MSDPQGSLSLFHPLVANWFRERIGTPTDVQTEAWPVIASGEHVLVTAPTGSGKTLTAFLWALNQLITGEYPEGQCSVLYISPLKALNNDIRRNLEEPLGELHWLFKREGVQFPRLRALTRSGDTPTEDRRRMVRHPPEILITTPESLNLLLSSRGGISMLGSLRTVILDEIHGVLDSKRGVHLISGVERLVRLSGEFQRIALSATVRPLELVAQYVGGYRLLDSGAYEPRPVHILRGKSRKEYDVRVRMLKGAAGHVEEDPVWSPIVHECREIARRNRSTLVFANSRRVAENMTWKMNDGLEELLAYAHHGSLSREIRAEVERRLKAGELRAIVATSSLEMGIDIGSLDEVVLVQSPPRISAAIQRVGRAGHQVGEVSRATLFPTHSHDLLEAAVLARSILDQNIEPIRPVRGALDVLAQVLISMTGLETWDIDQLFAEIRRSYPFRNITRRQFDLVLEMLSGRYEETRIRGLTARLSVDRIDNTVAARPGALQDLYISGGTIPDRGYLHLRDQRTNALIGELDEEFVWEAAPGQAMAFAAQGWRIERITHNDVFVTPTGRSAEDAPFWKGEEWGRDTHFTTRIAEFLETAEDRLDDPEFARELMQRHCLDEDSADDLLSYLRLQKTFCAGVLPHRHQIVVEHIAAGPGNVPGSQICIHNFWGGTINRPFAMALAQAWKERFGVKPEVYPSNDVVGIVMTEDVDGAEVMSLVTSTRLEELLRKSVEGSGFFGARFRECAGRALLITRQKMNQRMPLWVTRLRAKALLEAVLGFEDFPILLEAWRTCLQDEFDMEGLQERLGELESGVTTWTEVRTEHLSPFAGVLSWRQTNQYMYADDTPTGRTQSQLRGDLLREVVFSPSLRPTITPELVARFERKRKRLAPGYAPQTARDIVDWARERVLIPKSEWTDLLAAIQRDSGEDPQALISDAAGKLVWLRPHGSATDLVAAVEDLRRILPIWGPGASARPIAGDGPAPETAQHSGPDDERLLAVLGEWLSFFGPVSPDVISRTLGLEPERVAACVGDLIDSEAVIQGLLVRNGPANDICDSANFETLLRMARTEAVPAFEPLPAEDLALFLAANQGLCAPGEGEDEVWAALEQLSGYEARAELWEEAILPARVRGYRPALLDGLMNEGQLLWLGASRQKVAFCLADDLELVRESAAKRLPEELRQLFQDADARYTLRALETRTELGPERLADALWSAVWSGVLTNDTVASLRRGIACGFQHAPVSVPEPPQRRGRRGFVRRPRSAGAALYAGSWFRLPDPPKAEGLLEEEERAKDRARLLLERYGIVFRELLIHETPLLRWPAVFRALRLMELSGEIVGGRFFEGIPGLQFVTPTTLRKLQRELPRHAVWWINACDPVSLCGNALEPLKHGLPRRIPGNWIVYVGSERALVIQRDGADLSFSIHPDSSAMQDCLAPLANLLERDFRPKHRIVVETINGAAAAESPYSDALCARFDAVRESPRIIIRKRVG